MEVSPSALEFKGSFTKPTSEYLSLTNTSNTPLAFKVKTTAPKLYCVRPNASIVEPGNSIKISIILQGFSQPLPQDYKCKDKFLLVSLPCPDMVDAAKLGDYWPSLESKYKDQLVQKKLRVNYVVGEDVDSYDGGAAGNGAGAPQQREFEPQHGADGGFGSGVGSGAGSGAGLGAAGAAGVAGAGLGAAGAHVAGGQGGHYDPGFNADRSVNDAYAQGGPGADRSFANGGSDYSGAGAVATGASGATGVDSTPVRVKKAPSNDYQRDLDNSNAQVNSLSNKFDSNEKRDYQGAASTQAVTSTEEPSSGFSIPLVIVLILIAFLIGVLVF